MIIEATFCQLMYSYVQTLHISLQHPKFVNWILVVIVDGEEKISSWKSLYSKVQEKNMAHMKTHMRYYRVPCQKNVYVESQVLDQIMVCITLVQSIVRPVMLLILMLPLGDEDIFFMHFFVSCACTLKIFRVFQVASVGYLWCTQKNIFALQTFYWVLPCFCFYDFLALCTYHMILAIARRYVHGSDEGRGLFEKNFQTPIPRDSPD